MLSQNLNFHQYFPTTQDYLEFQYLSWFWVPHDSDFMSLSKPPTTGGAPKNSKRMWVRCALTYDDPYAASYGQVLFGEVEDYQVTYYNHQDAQQKAKQ